MENDEELWQTLVMMGKMCGCGDWENTSYGDNEVWGCLLCRAEIIERVMPDRQSKHGMRGRLLDEYKRRRDMG